MAERQLGPAPPRARRLPDPARRALPGQIRPSSGICGWVVPLHVETSGSQKNASALRAAGAQRFRDQRFVIGGEHTTRNQRSRTGRPGDPVAVSAPRDVLIVAPGPAAQHAGVLAVFGRGPAPLRHCPRGHVGPVGSGGNGQRALPARSPRARILAGLQILSSQSPHQGYSQPSGPRAAASHSCSRGRPPPAQTQQACASQKPTPTTG